MGTTKLHILPFRYLMSLEKLIRDTAGSQLVKKWRSIKKEEIGSIEDSMLPEILTIQAEAFKDGKPEILVKYVKRFRNIFYVIKSKDKIVGYCIYYLKPVISLKGFEKKSVICSVAIDKNFRGRGFAERLLRSSIEEMKVNGISSILLYVNINNLPAIQLYEKMGFQETRSIKNICGRKETCYEMELKLV